MRALRVLGDADGRTKGPALADALETTVGFVAQVVGPLVKAGWVRSDPGPTGGYVLTADLDHVSVLAVIEAVDGPTDTGRCVVADRACGGASPCVLHTAWAAGRAELVGALGGMPVSQLDALVAP